MTATLFQVGTFGDLIAEGLPEDCVAQHVPSLASTCLRLEREHDRRLREEEFDGYREISAAIVLPSDKAKSFEENRDHDEIKSYAEYLLISEYS